MTLIIKFSRVRCRRYRAHQLVLRSFYLSRDSKPTQRDTLGSRQRPDESRSRQDFRRFRRRQRTRHECASAVRPVLAFHLPPTQLTHLFSGSPGVGKTLTAEAISEHLELPFYSVSSSSSNLRFHSRRIIRFLRQI